MNYLTARNAFLKSCGPLTPEERARAIELYDKTLIAAQARFLDAWAAFIDELLPWRRR